MIDPAKIDWVSFDCYGTLIDWETGILGALLPVLEKHGLSPAREAILAAYARFEPQIQSSGYLKYRFVLQQVVEAFGREFKFSPDAKDTLCLEDSLPNWAPFADTLAGLRALKENYKLAILSNTDDDLFASTAQRLAVPFDAVITAEQLGSYKPALKNFHALVERVGVAPNRILHVAESRFHDIAPAKQLGLMTVWINRHQDPGSPGATPASDIEADLEVPDLPTLVGYLHV